MVCSSLVSRRSRYSQGASSPAAPASPRDPRAQRCSSGTATSDRGCARWGLARPLRNPVWRPSRGTRHLSPPTGLPGPRRPRSDTRAATSGTANMARAGRSEVCVFGIRPESVTCQSLEDAALHRALSTLSLSATDSTTARLCFRTSSHNSSQQSSAS